MSVGKKGKDKMPGQEGGGIIATIMSYFRRSVKDPRTPVKGIMPKLKNTLTMHYRGLIGMIVPICVLSWQGEKGRHDITVQCMWMLLFWFFLFQPVNIPVAALIPIFILPMTGVLSTATTCECYMNENIALFILGNMLILLLNNSGVDRRIALSFICSGDACQFSAKRLVFKCSLASFFLSMFSSRLITASTIMQYVTPPLMSLQSSTSKSRGTEPNYDEMRYIIINAIQTASAIGSIAIMHSAYATLAFRTIWCESAPPGFEYPDIFNYFQYSAYAFPVAFLMFILNCLYHMYLINRVVGKPMSANSMSEMRKALLKHKTALPRRTTLHEKLTVFFTIFYLVMFFFRWSKFINMGWADFRKEKTSPQIPAVKDATTAALFVIALHILPKGFGFLKYFSAETKSELPPGKPESAILWWRFVDRNMNYGYIFLLGTGVALQKAIQKSGLDKTLSQHFGKHFTDHSWNFSLFLVCLVSIILANAMSGVAACVIFLPFVINMSLSPPASTAAAAPGAAAATPEVPSLPSLVSAPPDHSRYPSSLVFRSSVWPTKVYLGALAVGIGSSFGFMFPFMYTPAYFCHYTGKVPKKRMAKYSIGSAIICLIILWLSLVYWAPYLWDPSDKGILPVTAPKRPAIAAGGGTGGNVTTAAELTLTTLTTFVTEESMSPAP